ncbi:MAG TPA: hypothetical protein PLM07_22005 [Candidatus Rifleibacterium sp.]|nr:hypothetical protein [Candidatus Rifleibacterium sp.]HPT48569.1 hypothetical protein [Candidatus Rifleibacterium sp.]
MGALLVLTGTLMLMMSSIWIIGEALKKDVLLGAAAMFLFPVYSIYYTFFVDYQRGHVPFFTALGGTALLLIGYLTGI